ncbi:cell envelope integrity protein TolA [Photobacterium sanctipauli]|uniref:Cell envelope integrity protein TolA n=1 Tax=Photobacterium sanctipauli TaxID=1342794 RepID=A0A2T3NR36_9GAMM|nr:cell envelope integrity protein TolA [Photobacterium sanctipauli]PSW18692.1 cell envelope integrity protein TolA [Photobacterium sanctipauli]
MKNNNYSTAIIISLVLHGLLVAALLWGTDFAMNEPKPAGNTIKAVVVDPNLVNQQAQRIREQREAAKQAEQDRLRRLEQQAEALEKQRQAEEQRLRQLKADKLKAEKEAREAEQERKRVAAERAKAAEEKRKADEAARVAREQAAKAEAERQAKQEAARKAEAERQRQIAEQRKAEEAKRQAEAEAKRAEQERQAQIAAKKKAEEEARVAEAARQEAERKAAEAREVQRQQEAALSDMFAGLEAETEQRGGARGQFIADETQRYGAIYTQMIQQNLLVEQSFIGRECVIRMRLSANGLVLDASEEGGDRSLCRAAKAAVVKVSQFPMPEDPAVIERLRGIRLIVSPQ